MRAQGVRADGAGDAGDATRRVLDFLEDRVDDGSIYYFKSKQIADDLGLSSQEVGHAVREIRTEGSGDVRVEPWGSVGQGSATTWRVEKR